MPVQAKFSRVRIIFDDERKIGEFSLKKMVIMESMKHALQSLLRPRVPAFA